MQALLASLVVSLGVKDGGYKSGMAAARAEAKKTGQDFEKAADVMGGAMTNAAGTIRSAANDINGVFGRLQDAVEGVARGFADMGKRMTIGISAPLGVVAGLSIKAASDAKELQSAYEQTFGALSGVMTRWAEESGDALGRSTQAMQQGAMAFGQLFNAAAPTRAAAAAMSQQFTELAQDAASFFNTDFDTAFGKIRSGLTGEAQPLRDFGVFLSEAAVQAKAVEMGLVKSGEKVNEYGKIMARAALITEGLSAASGDIVRTQDSFANRVRKVNERLAELSVEIGERLLPIAEKAVGVFDGMLKSVQALPKWVKDLAFNLAAVAAATGPVLAALSPLVLMILPLFLARLNPIFLAISLLANPVGTLVVLLGRLALSWTVLGRAIAAVIPWLLRFLGPVGIAISVLTILISLLTRTSDATRALEQAQRDGEAAQDQAIDHMNQLATATGKARVALQKLIEEKKRDQLISLREAEGKLYAYGEEVRRLRAQRLDQSNSNQRRLSRSAASRNSGVDSQIRGLQQQMKVELANIEAANRVLAIYNRPPETGERDYTVPNTSTTSTAGGGSDPARDAEQDLARYLDELEDLRVRELEALADLTGGIDAEYRARSARLDAERAAYVRSLALDEGLNDAQRAELLAAKDRELFMQRTIVEQDRNAALARENNALFAAQNDAQQDALRAQIDLAETAKDRRRLELQLLGLQKRQEGAQLDLIMATEATSSAAWENARQAKLSLDQRYAVKADQIHRQNMTPMEAYLDSLEMSAAEVGEAIENSAVSGLQRMNDALRESITSFLKLKGAAGAFVNTVLDGILQIAIQQQIIKPIANALFGGGGGGGGGLFGYLGGLLGGSGGGGGAFGALGGMFGGAGESLGVAGFGGHRRGGGRVTPGSWYMVGEGGPEPFIPDVPGTIIPNGAGGRRGDTTNNYFSGNLLTPEFWAQIQAMDQAAAEGAVVRTESRATRRQQRAIR
ncbi:hypothetical protein [Stakelama tenebrarum]|uniref:Bacteriophage tail tape measure N-terminal domain-containing protein n=1 Tax=Stakelama tenebrarum TaxID=2711215 RepID=A0A6G6Y6B1_9SPHN|nr:hypothetical protein [Sphingosinithalassobacter tenebrarum]QIG80116.1 hypothetical protein G5C33_10210 [Sphingosinithalassobacter tenebrarum]